MSCKSHGQDTVVTVLPCISECLLKSGTFFICVVDDLLVRYLNIGKRYKLAVKPLTVRLTVRILLLDLFIVDDSLTLRIDEQELTRM